VGGAVPSARAAALKAFLLISSLSEMNLRSPQGLRRQTSVGDVVEPGDGVVVIHESAKDERWGSRAFEGLLSAEGSSGPGGGHGRDYFPNSTLVSISTLGIMLLTGFLRSIWSFAPRSTIDQL